MNNAIGYCCVIIKRVPSVDPTVNRCIAAAAGCPPLARRCRQMVFDVVIEVDGGRQNWVHNVKVTTSHVISFHVIHSKLLQAVQQCVTVKGKSTTQLQLQSCTTWVWTNRYRHCWTKTMPFLSPSAASWWSDRSQVPYRSSHRIVMMSLHRITHVLSHSHS